MTPDEHAKATGREAIQATRRTLHAISGAIEEGRYGEAAWLYGEIEKQGALGMLACRRLADCRGERISE